MEAYNPKTSKWTTKESMNYALHGTQAIVSGKGVFIAGGSPTRGGGRQNNMEVYGEDAPAGTTLIASKIEADEEAMIAIGSTTAIPLKNVGGNMGSFITSVQIEGAKKKQL
jgi:hypothetical protein